MKNRKIFALMTGALMALSSMTFAGEWDITVFRPAVNPRDHKNDVMVRAGDKYKEATGGKVTYILGDWNTVESKTLSHMAAGDPIDVIFCKDTDFPKFYKKGYLQPIDDYFNFNFKGFDGKEVLNKTANDSIFKYNGKHYAASQYTSNHCWIIMYNKSLMEEEGIKESEQPLALYKAGKWDWDHFAALARKLTADTSGSGSIDRWGFGNWYTRGFIFANGGSFTNTDKNGNMVLAFNDPKVVEALTFLEKAKKEGWYQQDSNFTKEGIQNRTIAMYMEREYYPSSVISKTDDEICYVPVPHGPNSKNAPNIFECDGYGIGNGSKKQKAAGKFIEMALQEWYQDDMKNRNSSWPQEAIDLSNEMEKNSKYFGPTISAIDSMLDQFLGDVIWTGNSPAAAIEKYTPKAQALLSDANKPMEKLVRLPFKEINQTFDKIKDKDIAAMFTLNSEVPSAKVSIVKGAQAISGKQSLKLEFKPEEGQTGAVLCITNPEELGIVGWREYKISFKAKLSGDLLEDKASITAKAYFNELYEYGYINKRLDDATKVYEISGSINDVNQNGMIGIQFILNGCSSVIIDDIVISEKQ